MQRRCAAPFTQKRDFTSRLQCAINTQFPLRFRIPNPWRAARPSWPAACEPSARGEPSGLSHCPCPGLLPALPLALSRPPVPPPVGVPAPTSDGGLPQPGPAAAAGKGHPELEALGVTCV